MQDFKTMDVGSSTKITGKRFEFGPQDVFIKTNRLIKTLCRNKQVIFSLQHLQSKITDDVNSYYGFNLTLQ